VLLNFLTLKKDKEGRTDLFFFWVFTEVFILEEVELLKRKYFKEYARIAAYLPRRK
jgi:hypothetical protein